MPARCPSCNQVYADEALGFCPNDGATLIKEPPQPYNPQPGMGVAPAQPPSNYPPPPQPGYYAPQGVQAPPPPPPQGWQPPPYGQQQPPYGQQQYPPPQYGAPAKSSKMPLIIGLAALVLIGGGVGLYFLLSGNSSSSTTNTTTTNSTVTTSASPSRSPGTMTTSTYPTPSTTTSTGRSYTDDEKHRLFQAVGRTGDSALIIEVAKNLGIADANGQLNSNFQPFRDEHFKWADRNKAWVQEHYAPQKAREYVMANK